MCKKFYFRILFCSFSAVVILAGCSNTSRKLAVENERKNIITAELENKRRADVSLPDVQSVELLTFKAQPVSSITRSFTESPKMGSNDSQINTMYDGFGNKTEMRCLENDPVLRCVSLKTSTNGQKQATAFGKNGEAKRLPDEIADKVMSADASYIAEIAGIFELPKVSQTTPELPPPADVESFNQPILTPIPMPTATPELLVVEQKKKTNAEIKPEENSESKHLATTEASPRIVVDRFQLNNYLPKKKSPVNKAPN